MASECDLFCTYWSMILTYCPFSFILIVFFLINVKFLCVCSLPGKWTAAMGFTTGSIGNGSDFVLMSFALV